MIKIANDIQLQSLRKYQLLDRLQLAMANHVAMEATLSILLDRQIETLHVSGYNDTSCTFICQPTLSLYFYKASNI